MNSPIDTTTLIFAVLTVFVLFKLRSMLGTKIGHEADVLPAPNRAHESDNKVADSVIPDWSAMVVEGSGVVAALNEIAQKDGRFDAKEFLTGANAAYELIILAFATGDRDVLKNLLEANVYDDFDRAISERDKQGHIVSTQIVTMDRPLIARALIKEAKIQISVRFSAKLITFSKSQSGDLLEGSDSISNQVNDLWTFARPLGSRDPNWKLIATGAE